MPQPSGMRGSRCPSLRVMRIGPAGFAAMQITIPAHVAGPIPHAHDAFDEAIYVLRGRLLVAGDDEPQEAPAGSMFAASPRAAARLQCPAWHRGLGAGHLGPGRPGHRLHARHRRGPDPDKPPEPGHMREIYARHASRLLPWPPAAAALALRRSITQPRRQPGRRQKDIRRNPVEVCLAPRQGAWGAVGQGDTGSCGGGAERGRCPRHRACAVRQLV
jgi:hypothetical protein